VFSFAANDQFDMNAVSIGEPWMWGAFIAFVLFMLALDLFVLGGRKAHKVSVKEAALWSLAWFSLALLFNAGLWWHLNGTARTGDR
jgi:tellurite resistance protein TerC